MVSIVYMVAGMSSRFGGKIKQFAKVGPNNETLIELSMSQAKKAGFNKIIFIVGKKTKTPFKKKFGKEFEKIPIFYAKQTFDEKLRDKPWGTVDALLSGKEIITEDFVVCNGDDLYGEASFKKAKTFLEKGEDCVAVGYELGKVIPLQGKTNRGIFSLDKKNNVTEIKEFFDIEKNNLEKKGLNKKSPCSMNLFGLKKNSLELLEKRLNIFKEKNRLDKKAECLLPEELGTLIKSGKIRMKLLKTNDQWHGITNPEDEKRLRTIFSKNSRQKT